MSASSEHPAEESIAVGEDLAFAGVARESELLRSGEVTPRELVELYLTRIEALDPKLGAFVSVRAESALSEADAALERLRAGESGPLLGVPVAVKDNVDVAGELTGHGTRANHTPASSDAEVVRRLRSAGAPMLGKTAMPELAMWGHMTESEAHGPRAVRGTPGALSVAPAAGPPPPSLPAWHRSVSGLMVAPRFEFPRRCAGCSG